MDVQDIALSDSIIAEINVLQATRYLAASGLICVLWDHMLTIKDEWEYIWSNARFDLVRVIFVINRYGNEVPLLYVAYELAGFHGAFTPSSFMTAIMALGVVSMGIANVYATLRHYALWDHRRWARIALWTAFAVTYIPVCILFSFTLMAFHRSADFSPFTKTCNLDSKPLSMVGTWACMLAFDLFTLGLAITNALDRPYRHNVDIILHLQRDGATFFLALISMRIINLVVSITLGPSGIFLIVFFVWSMVSLTMSRLIMRVEAVRIRAMGVSNSGIHMYELDQWRSFTY